MKPHMLTIVMSFLAVGISGGIFLAALFHQFALVEVAASLLTGLQVFFFTSAVGDMLEKKKQPSRARNTLIFVCTIFLVAFYAFNRYHH